MSPTAWSRKNEWQQERRCRSGAARYSIVSRTTSVGSGKGDRLWVCPAKRGMGSCRRFLGMREYISNKLSRGEGGGEEQGGLARHRSRRRMKTSTDISPTFKFAAEVAFGPSRDQSSQSHVNVAPSSAITTRQEQNRNNESYRRGNLCVRLWAG